MVVHRGKQVEDTVRHRRFAALRSRHDSARTVKHDNRIRRRTESFGPTNAIDDEQVDALAPRLVGSELQQPLVVALGLGGKPYN